jgi:hypothetical protein
MRIHILGGNQRKGMYGVRTRASCLVGPTDFVITTWKSKVRSGTADPKMRILAKQISIIKAPLEIYKSYSNSE